MAGHRQLRLGAAWLFLGRSKEPATPAKDPPLAPGTNQQWHLRPTSDGYFSIITHDSGLAADDNWDASENAAIVQYTANGGNNQLWQLVPA
jgi:hypothetical protein